MTAEPAESAEPADPASDDLDQRRERARDLQHQVVALPAPLAVVACPGSGKTRTIVERHLQTPVGTAKGRAIVSFTKVASREIRNRALLNGRADLLDHPHVVMTLDAFFFRFLVRPFLPAPAADNTRNWVRLDSWEAAPREVRTFQVYVTPGDGSSIKQFSLADFDFSCPPQSSEPSAQLASAVRFTTGRRLTDAQVAIACRKALDVRRQAAESSRYLTGLEVRRLAEYYLEQNRDLLRQTLTARFTELVVDEVQDCSARDVELLLALQELGLPLVAVGDPDQAIYGFRSSTDAQVTRLLTPADTHIQRLHLNGNWRSSAVICALAAALRQGAGMVADDALADHHDLDLPVHVIARDRATEINTFHQIADQAQIPVEERVVLAHGTDTLPGVRRGSKRTPSNPTTALMWAVGILRHTKPGRRLRTEAWRTLETVLVRTWCENADQTTHREWETAYGIDRHHARRLAAEALEQLPDLDLTGSQWCTQARQVLTNLRPATAHGEGTTLNCPRSKGDTKALKIADIDDHPAGDEVIRADVVHQVKGDESDAVLLLLPDDDRTTLLISVWATQTRRGLLSTAPDAEASEALRVLYVAVTRARRLVTLAVPARHHATVGDLLLAAGVPVHRRSLP